MSFTPLIPMGGVGGWRFLKRTMATQTAAFQAAPANQRDEEYFRQKIGSVKTAEDLVADRKLLKVALGAFGLDADIGNKYFIRKVLEGGTLNAGSLANKLADKQYAKLSEAFGFDLGTPNTQMSTFANTILQKYEARQFESAVGAQNDDMRLALNAERELVVVAASTSSDTAKWLTILGSAPLRSVFQTAFGLPASFAAIDLDQQVNVLRSKTTAAFGDGNLSQFSDASNVEKLIQRFLSRSDATTSAVSQNARGYGALQLLQSSSRLAGTSILSLIR